MTFLYLRCKRARDMCVNSFKLYAEYKNFFSSIEKTQEIFKNKLNVFKRESLNKSNADDRAIYSIVNTVEKQMINLNIENQMHDITDFKKRFDIISETFERTVNKEFAFRAFLKKFESEVSSIVPFEILGIFGRNPDLSVADVYLSWRKEYCMILDLCTAEFKEIVAQLTTICCPPAQQTGRTVLLKKRRDCINHL